MQRVKLGRPDLEVSRICFGTWQFGGDWESLDEQENVAAMQRALERDRPVETLQPPYHLFRRDIEDDVLPYCRERDIGVLVYGPLAHGLLSGKFDRDTQLDEDDWRASSELFQGESYERNLAVVEELGSFAEERGHTVAQLAVAWTLAQPGVQVAIVGARRPDHIEGTAPAADIELSDDDLERIDSIMEGAVPVAGPTPEG